MRTLITGWFSFQQMGASAGDLLARDLVTRWLDEAAHPYDVALADPFEGGVDWREVDPGAYSELVFVCGPLGNGEPVAELLERFRGCVLVGLDVTMLEPLETWNPFDLLVERESVETARPDLVFLTPPSRAPVVGLVRIDAQPEYGQRDLHERADGMLDAFLGSCEAAVVAIDTRLDVANSDGLRTAAEVESLIARMDVVVTTRLHGLVLALKNGVPAVAVDTVAGGAKVTRQAEAVGWPVVLGVETLDQERIRQAFDYCLTGEARGLAERCARGAVTALAEVRERLLAALEGQ